MISGLPWWLRDKESACQCRRRGVNAWSRKFPHAVEPLSPWATSVQPIIHKYSKINCFRILQGQKEIPLLTLVPEVYFLIVYMLIFLFSLYVNQVHQFSSVQSLSHVLLFATPWIAARQASLSITNSRIHSDSGPSSQWCHPAISSSVIPFSSCP